MAFYNAHIHRAKFAFVGFNIITHKVIFFNEVNQVSGMNIDFFFLGRFYKPKTFGGIEKLNGSFLHIYGEDEAVMAFGF